jgi:hypothetical protein
LVSDLTSEKESAANPRTHDKVKQRAARYRSDPVYSIIEQISLPKSADFKITKI